jgi:hypothetical protein
MQSRVFVSQLILALAATAAQAQGQWQALPDPAPAPADNPTTAAKVDLGKRRHICTRALRNRRVPRDAHRTVPVADHASVAADAR